MKIQKVTRARGEYAKKGIDMMPGDEVVILSEGEWIEGDFGKQFVIKIATRNGEKNVTFNQTTLNILHDELGEDTSRWLSKSVVVRAKKDVVAGKKVDIYYFVTPEWDFDEYRELVKVSARQVDDRVSPEDQNINPDDIPF